MCVCHYSVTNTAKQTQLTGVRAPSGGAVQISTFTIGSVCCVDKKNQKFILKVHLPFTFICFFSEFFTLVLILIGHYFYPLLFTNNSQVKGPLNCYKQMDDFSPEGASTVL